MTKSKKKPSRKEQEKNWLAEQLEHEKKPVSKPRSKKPQNVPESPQNEAMGIDGYPGQKTSPESPSVLEEVLGIQQVGASARIMPRRSRLRNEYIRTRKEIQEEETEKEAEERWEEHDQANIAPRLDWQQIRELRASQTTKKGIKKKGLSVGRRIARGIFRSPWFWMVFIFFLFAAGLTVVVLANACKFGEGLGAYRPGTYQYVGGFQGQTARELQTFAEGAMEVMGLTPADCGY